MDSTGCDRPFPLSSQLLRVDGPRKENPPSYPSTDGGSRTLNNMSLSHVPLPVGLRRRVVEVRGVEPRTTGCRPVVLPLAPYPHEWAGRDSNPRVVYLIYSQAQSPLCHRPIEGMDWVSPCLRVNCLSRNPLEDAIVASLSAGTAKHGCQESNPEGRFWRPATSPSVHPQVVNHSKELWPPLVGGQQQRHESATCYMAGHPCHVGCSRFARLIT